MSSNGTLIKPRYQTLYFDNIDANSKEELQSYKKNTLKNIEEIKSEILALCMSTPKDIFDSEEYSDPFNYIKNKFKELSDELSEQQYDLNTIDFIENILDEWDYSCSSEKELYKDNEINPFVTDKHVDIEFFKKNSFTFTPNDKSLIDIFTRGKQNIELNRDKINVLKNKYIILFDNEIFSDYTGQFLFSSEKNARDVLFDKLDIHTYEYINKDFIQENKEFFYSFKNVLSDEKYSILIENIDKFVASETKFAKENLSVIDTIYNLLNEGITNMFNNHIKIIKLDSLEKQNNI